MVNRILIFLILFPFFGEATHIVGGEIYYDCLGSNNYKITVKVYRDCGPANTMGTPFDDPLPITIYDAANNLINVVSVPLSTPFSIPTISSNICLTPPPQCIEVATFQTIVNLPPSPGGYTIVYQRCCRNSSIQNLLNPSNSGGTYFARIPDPGIVTCNSSPRFSTLPPLVICMNDNFTFNHSATDPNGDSLVYSFYTPYEGGSSSSPAPNPAAPPPYIPESWAPGYTQNAQIGGAPSLTINSATGVMNCRPNLTGIYVYAVKVAEYRGGIFLSESMREFQINVVNCTIAVQSIIAPQTAIQLCGGLTLVFTNNSINATTYLWNFGDTTTTADTSVLTNPSYTYPDTGTYNVTLIANPNSICADTITIPFVVHLPLSVSFIRPPAQCLDVNNFSLNATGQFDANAVVVWNLPLASPSGFNVNPTGNFSYSDSGKFIATVQVNEFGCSESYSDTLFVYPLPVALFSYPNELACEPYTVQFSDSSISWSALTYFWTFGDGETSTLANPIHTYPDTGLYSVSLTIVSDTICVNTQTFSLNNIIHVFPSPDAGIIVYPRTVSIFTPQIEVQDIASGYTSQTIYFDDGDSTLAKYAKHSYLDTGWFNVTQFVINEFGCIDTAVIPVYVIPETTVYIPNAFTPNNDGYNDVFLPVIRDVRRYEFYIYDRWGTVIWKTINPLEGWDGKRSGDKMKEDVYVYLVRYMLQDYTWQEKRGHFSLLK